MTSRHARVTWHATKMADRGSGELHLLSYFLPGLLAISLSSRSLPFLSCRKNLSFFFPQGGITRTRSLVSALACPESSNPSWRPDSPVLRSLLPFPAHTLSRCRSRSFIFWTLSFHLLFSHIVSPLLFAFFFFSPSLPCQKFIHHQSSSPSASNYSPFSSHSFFLITKARRNLATLILQPLNAEA